MKLLQKAKIYLLIENPFWGSLIARLELKEWDGDTFATDGKVICIPDIEKHFAGITFQQIVGILAHETFHCVAGHIFRMKNRNRILWNVACDYATNTVLMSQGFQLPSDCLYDVRFDGMTAEKIYDILLQENSKKKCPQDMLEPGSQKANNDDGKGMTPSQKDAQAKELEQEWKELVTSAVRMAKQAGQLPGGMEEYIDGLLFPKVPWQTHLYKHLQISAGNTDYSSYPFNRRHIWREIYLPSTRGEKIDVVCAMDTSGSIDKEDMQRYLSEIRGICGTFGSYTIHFFQADTEIASYNVIEDDSEIPTLVQGRGGTCFKAVFNRVEEDEDMAELPVIYFTDLDGSFPSQPPAGPVFWLIRKSQNSYGHEVPFGTIIEIDD